MTIIGLQALASLGGHGARRFLGVECQYASKRSRSHRGNDPGRPRAKDYGTVASPTPKRVRHLRCLQSFESGDVQCRDGRVTYFVIMMTMATRNPRLPDLTAFSRHVHQSTS